MGKFDSELEQSPNVKEVLDGLSKNTQHNYKASLRQFLRFVNSKKGLNREVSIDELVKEAKSYVGKIEELLDLFYDWLQNKEVEGYIQRGKKMKESSANQRAYGYLRGFFANLDIAFERKWTRRIPKVKRPKQAIKKDMVYTFYDVDEKTKTIRFNRELMQQFLANLKLRDVAITLALLSSSQDSGDFFKLNVGDIREQGGKRRIFLEGTRNKTSVLFRTFLSKEATRFIRKYLNQERKNAEDKDPLFVYTRYQKMKQPNGKVKPVKVEKRMTPTNLASIYRDAARKMGIKWDNGEHNPLRPKRMRHLFRTACDAAGVPELYTNAFMGHRNHMGQEYSELSKAKLELEYLRVEPFLTVYSQTEENLEIKEDVRKMETRIVDLNKEIADHKRATEKFRKENLMVQRELQLLNDILNPLQPMLEFVNSFESPGALMEFLEAIKERSAIARQRAESMPKLTKKARELLHKAVSDIIQKESQRVKQLLSQKTGITNEDILQAAIQAAKESIEEEYGIEIGAKEEE
ncbi:MAG: tyrosine-type recombinase/integrase [Candidatus Bathyarchaeota archaeon]